MKSCDVCFFLSDISLSINKLPGLSMLQQMAQYHSSYGGVTFHCTYILCMCMCSAASVVENSATLWTIARQAPQSMGFSRQENWNGFPYPSLGDFPDPGMKPSSPTLQADSLATEPPGKPLYTISS